MLGLPEYRSDDLKPAGTILLGGETVRVFQGLGVIAFALMLGAGTVSAQSERRPMTFDDLIAMHRVSDPRMSPDGRYVAYTVATPDVEANRVAPNIWVVPTDGGEPRQLTRSGSDQRPRWSPDGTKLAFLSARDGSQQVYWIALAGGEATRLTSLSGGGDNELWSPDGKTIAFVSSVYPDCADDDCNVKRDAEKQKSKVKAHVATKLLYRHWTTWSDGKRSHLFVIPSDGSGKPRDLTPGADYDVPPFNLGAPESIGFSPDSAELGFTANTDLDAAISTNGDIFTVPVIGSSAPKRITENHGDDWGPVYSPDGKWIAYRSQFIPADEADRWRLMIYDRAAGKHVDLTEKFDRNVDAYEWAADSKAIFFKSEDQAQMPIYSIAAAAGNTPVKVISDGFNMEFDVSRDGRSIAFTRTSLVMPPEIFVAKSDGDDARQLSHHNAALLAQLEISKAESFWFEGAAGAKVNGLLVRPPNFDATKKYPLLFLVHGGPQGAWDDEWGYRWNPQVMAAPGYVVVMVNPRGSTGYGQKFTAEISKDWGGKVYTDLMNGLDAAIAKYPFIDGVKTCAAGASYGGFMMDWMATHTGRFKCIISHAGPYDARSMYATEELWFQEWEYGGTPWEHPELYDKWSSVNFAGALGKFKTPTLVVGGELDFRVPYTQDLEFFSALQRQNVPSKLVIFPDEGHWVLKPQNSQFWYKTFLDWLATYLK
jgi:dipeptidyl aminopeptidase/acylaminoacyl peptidase